MCSCFKKNKKKINKIQMFNTRSRYKKGENKGHNFDMFMDKRQNHVFTHKHTHNSVRFCKFKYK